MPSRHNQVVSPLQFWLSLSAIGILIVLLNVEFSAVNLALVPISKDMDVTLNHLQWVLSGYILVWGALVVPAGRLSDLYGKKKMLLIGLSVFLTGSFLAGLSYNLFFLILGRIIQGMGAAFFSAPAYGIIFMTAPPHLQGLAIGVIASFGGFGLAIGPTLAGYLIESFSWRWVFYINLPLGALTFFVCAYLIPKDAKPSAHPKINYATALLLILGLAGFVGGINQIEVWGIHNIFIWLVIGLSLFLLFLFYKWDQHAQVQTLPKSLLFNQKYRATLVIMFALAYVFATTLFQITLYLQSVLRFSPYHAGLIMMFLCVAYGILSPVGGKITDKFGIQKPLYIGLVSNVFGLGCMLFVGQGSSIYFLCLPLVLLGIGLGTVFPAVNTGMFKTPPPSLMNTASSLFTMLMMMGNTIGVIVSSSLLVFVGDKKLTELLHQENIVLSPEQYSHLVTIISKAQHDASDLVGFPQEKIQTLLNLIDYSFLSGFKMNMGVCVFMCGIAAFFTWRHMNLEMPQMVSQEGISQSD